MALLTATAIAQDSSADITAAALTAATGGGDTVAYDPDLFLVVNNADSNSMNVTLAPTTTSAVLGNSKFTASSTVIAVAAGKYKIIPIGQEKYRNASSLIPIAYSSVTSLTVGVFKIAKN